MMQLPEPKRQEPFYFPPTARNLTRGFMQKNTSSYTPPSIPSAPASRLLYNSTNLPATSLRWNPKIADENSNLKMTAIFNFQSLLLVILLFICTNTYLHGLMPSIIDRNKDGMIAGIVWKSARVGERLSPYVSIFCVCMAVSVFWGQ